MWVNKIELHDFRAFQNHFEMNLAKNITCISGHNGIGKSTILAVLSNCGELKKSIGTQLNGSIFRGEFSDIIIGDEAFDKIGDKANLHFNNLPVNTQNSSPSNPNIFVPNLEFRATFQGKTGNKKDTEKRFRLIPKKIKGIRTSEAKLPWPTIYLGLSRLYPVGESEKAISKNLPDRIMDDLLKEHQSILGMQYGENAKMESIGLKELRNKRKTGVKTSKYSSTSNSAGQDNIGQIILSVLSFKELKQKLGPNYTGGILLIDEIDATLHPAVQYKLFDYLLKKSVELDIQIVFTTHSILLLEHITKFYKNSGVLTNYLLKRDKSIITRTNPTKKFLNEDLTNTYHNSGSLQKRVKLLTEDSIANWFLEQILKNYHKQDVFNFDILDIDMSWHQIVKFLASDEDTFSNYMTLLDPDVLQEDKQAKVIEWTRGTIFSSKDSSIFYLPASQNVCIEEELWNYLNDLDDEHEFFTYMMDIDKYWPKHLIIENGPESEKYNSSKKNINLKNWFKDNQHNLQYLIIFWIKDNKALVDKFMSTFEQAYRQKVSKL